MVLQNGRGTQRDNELRLHDLRVPSRTNLAPAAPRQMQLLNADITAARSSPCSRAVGHVSCFHQYMFLCLVRGSLSLAWLSNIHIVDHVTLAAVLNTSGIRDPLFFLDIVGLDVKNNAALVDPSLMIVLSPHLLASL